MNQKITPFLWFNKNAEEAMNFYVSIFAGNPAASGLPAQSGESKILNITRYPEGPLEGPMAGMEGKVLTEVFLLNGQKFLALDGGPYFKPTGAISLYIECESQEEVDYFWDKLTEGGDPKAQQCGWLIDKYGFSWQVIPTLLQKLLGDPDKEKSGRVMAAMMQMKKIDTVKLQEAYDQK